jgi:hypothetical protein
MEPKMAEQIKIAERKKEDKVKPPVPISYKTIDPDLNPSYMERVLYLQRSIGNQKVTRLIRSGVMHAKLSMNALGGKNHRAHELTQVFQQTGGAAQGKIQRQAGGAACNPCPNPVNPTVNVSIRPRVRNVVLPSNGIAETPWNTANVTFVSVWHRERRNCNTCAAPGGTMDGWDLCARKINILATVNMDINQAEINRVGGGGERWYMDCGNTTMGATFITRANAMTTLTTPRRYTIAGGRAHEGYHVQVSERLLRERIRARNDIRQICPYSATVIAAWKTNLETTIKNDANAFLQGNPQEPNEERNANAAACPFHAVP